MKNLFYGEKHSFIESTYAVGVHWNCLTNASMRQFQCVPTTYVTEIKKTYFEIYTKQVACKLAFLFKHLKMPISIKIPVTILKPTANWSPYIFTLVQKVKHRVYKIRVLLSEAILCRDSLPRQVISFRNVVYFLHGRS